jgi:predicted nucleic acid binding AN1-type Zn finger protein
MSSKRKLAAQQAKTQKKNSKASGHVSIIGSCDHCKTNFFSKYDRKNHACAKSVMAQYRIAS